MLASRSKNALGSVILVLVIALVAGAAATGGYYLSASTSARPQNQTNPGAITVTSTVTVTSSLLQTTTITQGQTIANANNAVLNMTYSSSCVSVGNSCSGSGYSILFENTGNSIVSGGTVQIYFGNGTSIYGQSSCTFNSTILPQYTFTCSGLTPSNVPAYSNVILSIVYPNGKTYSYTYTAPFGITLSSATLYGGTEPSAVGVPAQSASYIVFALNNLGSPTSITGITMTGLISAISTWGLVNGSSVNFALSSSLTPQHWANGLPGNHVTSFTFYPYGTAQNLVRGAVFNYVINFANGQSVSGSLISQ